MLKKLPFIVLTQFFYFKIKAAGNLAYFFKLNQQNVFTVIR